MATLHESRMSRRRFLSAARFPHVTLQPWLLQEWGLLARDLLSVLESEGLSVLEGERPPLTLETPARTWHNRKL